MGTPRVKFVFKGKPPTKPRVKFVFKGKRPNNDDTEARVQTHHHNHNHGEDESTQWTDDKHRRKLRQQYRHVIAEIDSAEKEEDLTKPNSEKFNSIVNEVNTLYNQVTMGREQVSDAEALLRMSEAIVSEAKSYSKSSLTPSRFVTCLLRKFGSSSKRKRNNNTYFSWRRLGLSVSHLFMKAHGCLTMYSPLINNNGPSSNIQTKKRKRIQIRPPKPMLPSKPNEFDISQSWVREKSNTERIVEVMHRVLRRKKREKVNVVLENLVLNRISFSQTVENLFALSFLVKDGRVEIIVNDRNSHIVSTKTPPDRASLESGKVEYSHFVFRFDFKDWMMMKDFVAVGEELMHHRIRWDEEIEDIKPKIVTVAQQNPNQDDTAMSLLPLVSVVTKA